MLVTLALTLIMMILFAQIFQITASFASRHKGIAENDQSARNLTTLLKTDLQNRTMRFVAPFHPGMPALPDDPSRQGYFYYSENSPIDDTDDILQFTVQAPLDRLLVGRATFLPTQTWQSGASYLTGAYVQPTQANANGCIYVATTGGAVGGGEPAWPKVVGTPVPDGGVTWQCVDATLQPDGDDGVLNYNSVGNLTPMDPSNGYSVNNTGASQYAELSYFLRHGNLYRRVLLVRAPYSTSSGGTQPGTTVNPMISGSYNAAGNVIGTGSFWTDFDYSARFDNNLTGTPLNGPLFFDSSNLSNVPASGGTYPLGRPDNRFGHDQTDGSGTIGTTWPTASQTGNGAPREFDTNTPPTFFGRFTQEECTNSMFGFPGYIPAAGSPMAQATTAIVNSVTGGITQYTAAPVGARRGDDILLTNVLAFDVKLIDPHYVETAGNDVNRNGIIEAGPAPAFADVGHTAGGDFQQSKNNYPVYGPHVAQSPNTYTVNGVLYNYNNVFDTWHRMFDFDNIDVNHTHDTNGADPAPYRPRFGNSWQATTVYTVGTIVDPVTNLSNGYIYKCSVAGTSGGPNDPFSLTDQVGGSTITDGTVQWQTLAPVAVQAIQITVKYLDPTQNLLRQVTIVQSLKQ
jgi:hypothetical protein